MELIKPKYISFSYIYNHIIIINGVLHAKYKLIDIIMTPNYAREYMKNCCSINI